MAALSPFETLIRIPPVSKGILKNRHSTERKKYDPDIRKLFMMSFLRKYHEGRGAERHRTAVLHAVDRTGLFIRKEQKKSGPGNPDPPDIEPVRSTAPNPASGADA
jgi:hypothetical protein